MQGFDNKCSTGRARENDVAKCLCSLRSLAPLSQKNKKEDYGVFLILNRRDVRLFRASVPKAAKAAAPSKLGLRGCVPRWRVLHKITSVGAQFEHDQMLFIHTVKGLFYVFTHHPLDGRKASSC